MARSLEWFEYQIDDGPIEIAVSILVPYGAYLAAESVKASGVLAVVACGLYLRPLRARSSFATSSITGVGGLGCIGVRAEWRGVRFDRAATSIRDGGDRGYVGEESCCWYGASVQRNRDSVEGTVDVSGREACVFHSHSSTSPE